VYSLVTDCTRRELWRRDVEMDTNIQTYKNDLLKSEKQLQSTVNKIVSSGLNAVHRIAEETDIKGVYGPLIELFECPDQYMTAVEIAAGGSLFFIVVDTEETAAKILDIMSKEKVGRVTFMPLNRLAVKDVPLPDSPDVKPMISELKFKPVLQKAFQQVTRTMMSAAPLTK
jgi:structural maintenance of chromosome 3 (chondroitin sulfate proteoglycan 6)